MRFAWDAITDGISALLLNEWGAHDLTMVKKAQGDKTAFHRRASEARGRRAELIAAIWLTCKGYRVLARRAKTKLGEIDLVARKGNVLAFIEVKARSSFNESLAALTPQSARRIARAAALWTSPRPWARSLAHRFDIVAIVPGRAPRHVADAFRPEAERF